MSINTDELEPRFRGTLEHIRRQQDHVLDFMHWNSERRAGWILGLEHMVFEDHPEFLEQPGVPEIVQWATREAPQNIREAFFYLCITLYPNLRAFLLDSEQVAHPNRDRLAYFFMQILPELCRQFLQGAEETLGTDAFVRNARTRYLLFVGVDPDPVARWQREEQQRATQKQ